MYFFLESQVRSFLLGFKAAKEAVEVWDRGLGIEITEYIFPCLTGTCIKVYGILYTQN